MPIPIRFQIQLINFDADPDFYLIRMQIWMLIQVTKMMWILPDPDQDADQDPQHCFLSVDRIYA
jgi:hypothetical protein